ncbi:hypothetical protein F5Y09DRAFT_291710 [Xylaria sp. FL1042]|nr:hypothetical protein F5Y09DRAFT_291710 [Xylaria sp. FL1042]
MGTLSPLASRHRRDRGSKRLSTSLSSIIRTRSIPPPPPFPLGLFRTIASPISEEVSKQHSRRPASLFCFIVPSALVCLSRFSPLAFHIRTDTYIHRQPPTINHQPSTHPTYTQVFLFPQSLRRTATRQQTSCVPSQPANHSHPIPHHSPWLFKNINR